MNTILPPFDTTKIILRFESHDIHFNSTNNDNSTTDAAVTMLPYTQSIQLSKTIFLHISISKLIYHSISCHPTGIICQFSQATQMTGIVSCSKP